MNTSRIVPFIILGGALQSCGAAMNGQLAQVSGESLARLGGIIRTWSRPRVAELYYQEA